MNSKKVLAFHDISCFGRCSIQTAVPVISNYGHQVCPLPTALLSTHTGGYEGFTFLDLTEECLKIIEHWKSLELKFDAIYTGFVANEQQIDMINTLIENFAKEDTIKIIDPVMGDNGKIYRTYNEEMCRRMRVL
ncbi:pyridoxal kinase, partial [Eubacteriales bacterium OttesenSCG-928-G02]|nr:pyridoxal kinase [Eubacteriales bacterium OttesenSCG-928-G02]